MEGQWQVVRTKERKRAPRDEQPKPAANGHAHDAIAVRAKAAFADLDAWERPSPSDFSSLAPPDEEPPHAKSTGAQNGVGGHTPERQAPPKKPKAPRKPKARAEAFATGRPGTAQSFQPCTLSRSQCSHAGPGQGGDGAAWQ